MNVLYLKVGQLVQHKSGTKIMKVIGFDITSIENVITQWKDESGKLVTAKFKQIELKAVYD